jgi:hypothetical protein
MRPKLRVRVIKRNQRHIPPAPTPSGAETEQRCKTIISSWVKEHRRHMEEVHQNFRDLLREKGFLASPL